MVLMAKTKAADEVFCRSCGEPIKKEAEICPKCGVRNRRGSQSRSNNAANTHDPSQFETTVSENWHYGVTASVVLWVVVIAAMDFSESAILGLVMVGAWALMPLSIYFDAMYVRANSKWNPNTVTYIIGSIIWILNIVVGLVYLYRRHEALGKP